MGGGGQIAPHHGEQVIDAYGSDEEAKRSAHQQRLAQHSSSAVLINSEPLLIKSEPGAFLPQQHPKAQQSHAVGSRDPSTTYDAHSAHPATQAQPSATSLSKVMVQPSAFAADIPTPMLAMQQAHLTESEAPADPSTKSGQRKRLREEVEIQNHPSHAALRRAPTAKGTHAADRPASVTAADAYADAQLILVSAAHQVVPEGKSHPGWINLVFEPRAKLHARLPANLDSQPGSAQQADCNAPAGLASRAHVPYKAMLMPPGNSAASELDAAVQPGFKLQADSASHLGSTPGQHHQGMLASQKTLQELQAQFVSCGRYISDSPSLLHTMPHALQPAVPPTPLSLPSMPQAKDWLHHSLLQAPKQQSHLQLQQPTPPLQPSQPSNQSCPSSQPTTLSTQHLVSWPKPSGVDNQQAAVAASMPIQGSQQSLPAALQLATVLDTQTQTAPSSKPEQLEVLLQRFAWGPNPKGDSPHGILEELVAHLTDAM